MIERDLLSLGDLSPLEFATLLDLAVEMKDAPAPASVRLHGRAVGLIFEAPSTRTRVASVLAVQGLGAQAVPLDGSELRLSEGESLEDTARSLGLYLDALLVRTPGHDRVERVAESAPVPVVNAGTDIEHPTQALTDLFTIRERFGSLRGTTIAYVGAATAPTHSLLLGAALGGMDVRLACPEGQEPFPSIVDTFGQLAEPTGASISFHQDPIDAVANAQVVYTDSARGWHREDPSNPRFQVSQDLVERGSSDSVVMHPLPARRGHEIAAAVLDGPRSVVAQQAQNKVPILKAVLVWLLG